MYICSSEEELVMMTCLRTHSIVSVYVYMQFGGGVGDDDVPENTFYSKCICIYAVRRRSW